MVFRSPFPDVEIPDVSLHQLLFGDIADRVDRVALIDGMSGASMTYGQLSGAIDRMAAALAARGIGKGDVVGILSPNTPYYAVVFHGILRAGATATTINALYTPDEVAHQLHDAGAKMLFTVSVLLPNAAPGAAKAGVSDVVVLDKAEGYPSLGELLANDHPVPEVEIDPAEDIAVLPYSSGTTALPKGVMLTHRNLVANLVQCGPILGDVGAHTRILAVLPFFHIYGMQVLMNNGLYVGGAVVTLPKFELPEFLRVIAEHRTDRVYIAPPVAVALAKHPIVDNYDLSAMKMLVLRRRAARRGPRRRGEEAHRLQGRAGLRHDRDVAGQPRHPGRPRGHLDRHGRRDHPESGVPSGRPGHRTRRGRRRARRAVVQGPEHHEGLPEQPGGHRRHHRRRGLAAHRRRGRDRRRRHRLDRRPGQGTDQVQGLPGPARRAGGRAAHPREIADAAVIGVRDADGEEVPKAFVVRQQGSELSGEAVMAFVAANVAPHKKVRVVEFIEAIPKSAAGKILRKDLRARETA